MHSGNQSLFFFFSLLVFVQHPIFVLCQPTKRQNANLCSIVLGLSLIAILAYGENYETTPTIFENLTLDHSRYKKKKLLCASSVVGRRVTLSLALSGLSKLQWRGNTKPSLHFHWVVSKCFTWIHITIILLENIHKGSDWMRWQKAFSFH